MIGQQERASILASDGYSPRLVRLEHWRSRLHFHGGGEARHRRRLSEHLALRGVETRLATLLHDEDAEGCDVLHAWNVQDPREAVIALRWAKARGLTTVLTPLLARRSALVRGQALAASLLGESLSKLEQSVAAFADGSLEQSLAECAADQDESDETRELRAEAFELSDVVLCLSRGEIELLVDEHDVPRDRLHATTVGVDSQLGVRSSSTNQQVGTWDVVLVPTTRIETLKNQLAVILAARELPYRFVLTGTMHDPAYSALCSRLANERVDFVGLYDEAEIAEAMRRARVILHPSLLECASLALLEAAISGASLVTSDVGSVREYLGSAPRYVDPCSVRSIVQAVREAWEEHPSEARRRRDLQLRALGYDWERAASETISAIANASPHLEAQIARGALA